LTPSVFTEVAAGREKQWVVVDNGRNWVICGEGEGVGVMGMRIWFLVKRERGEDNIIGV
jgi:hypothetical protein